MPQSRMIKGEIMNPRAVTRAVCLVTMFLGGAWCAQAQDAATRPATPAAASAAPPAAAPAAAPVAAPADPQAAADSIAKEVAQIRGLTFKQPVAVEKQSPGDFGGYVARRIDETVPEKQRNNYGAIVR